MLGRRSYLAATHFQWRCPVQEYLRCPTTWVPGRQVALLLWAYFAAVAVDPGRVPPDWHPFGSDEVRPATGPGCDAGVPCAGAC